MTVYDGRPAGEAGGAIAHLGDRDVDLRLGPDVDPASTWAGAALVATSPSITPDYPTTEPRLRSQLQALVARRAGRRPLRARAGRRGGPVPPAVPGADGRRHGHQGQDDDVLAGPRDPLRRPDHPAVLGGNIGDAADRAPARAHARTTAWSSSCPSSSCRRCRAGRPSRSTRTSPPTTSTATARSRRTGWSSAASRSSWTPRGRSCSTPRTRWWPDTGISGRARRHVPGRPPRQGGLGVLDEWIVAAGVERLPLAGGGIGGDRAGWRDHAGGRARDPRAPQRVERPGRDRGRAAVRRRARRDPPRRRGRSPASSTGCSRSRSSTACASSTTPRAPSPTP